MWLQLRIQLRTCRDCTFEARVWRNNNERARKTLLAQRAHADARQITRLATLARTEGAIRGLLMKPSAVRRRRLDSCRGLAACSVTTCTAEFNCTAPLVYFVFCLAAVPSPHDLSVALRRDSRGIRVALPTADPLLYNFCRSDSLGQLFHTLSARRS